MNERPLEGASNSHKSTSAGGRTNGPPLCAPDFLTAVALLSFTSSLVAAPVYDIQVIISQLTHCSFMLPLSCFQFPSRYFNPYGRRNVVRRLRRSFGRRDAWLLCTLVLSSPPRVSGMSASTRTRPAAPATPRHKNATVSPNLSAIYPTSVVPGDAPMPTATCNARCRASCPRPQAARAHRGWLPKIHRAAAPRSGSQDRSTRRIPRFRCRVA